VERPCALGASPALKILSFDPHQFATHRGTPRNGAVCFFERRYRTGLRRHADDKSRSFHCPERGSVQITAFEHTSKTEGNTQGLKITDSGRNLSVGYQTQ